MPIKNLKDYHLKNMSNFNSIVTIKGIVQSLVPLSNGGMIVNLMDIDEEESLDVPAISCWLPKGFKLNFGNESEIIVLGRTNYKNDQISVNVHGVCPVKVVNVPVKQIGEDDLNITSESDDF